MKITIKKHRKGQVIILTEDDPKTEVLGTIYLTTEDKIHPDSWLKTVYGKEVTKQG